jgi:hypothetical protein
LLFKHLILAALLAATVLTVASAQIPIQRIQQSHIEANVPDAGSFGPLLRRDLLGYFP